ncbi:MAG: zf-HC2 domain-containing protein [Aeoliella sp.]
MNCKQIIDQLSAWIDNELTSEQSQAIEKHLDSCSECSTLADELRSMHEETVQEFSAASESAERVVERVINQIPIQNSVRVSKSDRIWHRYASLVAAAAAGFLLAAVFLPRPTSSPTESHNAQLAQIPFAAVRVSTGPLEVAPACDSTTFSEQKSPIVKVGTKLRTGIHKGELQTPSGATIRLDSETQISVRSEDELILESGRLFCCPSSDASTVAVSSKGATFQISDATCDIKCDGESVELIALDGSIQVLGDDSRSNVESGDKVRFVSGKIVDKVGVRDPVIETRWIHELLLRKSFDDDELQQRVEQLWASLGHSKMQYLYEEEIRAIGCSSVKPLSAFLSSEDESHQRDHRRKLAAQIVSDVADFRAIPRLIDLLDDKDPQVRLHIARGLKRITGRDMGMTPEQLMDATVQQRATLIVKWREWWSRWKESPDVL